MISIKNMELKFKKIESSQEKAKQYDKEEASYYDSC